MSDTPEKKASDSIKKEDVENLRDKINASEKEHINNPNPKLYAEIMEDKKELKELDG